MRAQIGDVELARAPQDEIVMIEGNPTSHRRRSTPTCSAPTQTPYTCPWKGVAQYWDVSTSGGALADVAWSYPEPYDGAEDRVGHGFAGYFAFDNRQVSLIGD